MEIFRRARRSLLINDHQILNARSGRRNSESNLVNGNFVRNVRASYMQDFITESKESEESEKGALENKFSV